MKQYLEEVMFINHWYSSTYHYELTISSSNRGTVKMACEANTSFQNFSGSSMDVQITATSGHQIYTVTILAHQDIDILYWYGDVKWSAGGISILENQQTTLHLTSGQSYTISDYYSYSSPDPYSSANPLIIRAYPHQN